MIYGRMSVTFKYSQLPSMHMETYFFRNLLFLLLPLISTRRVYADAECLILNSCTTRTRTRKNKTYNTSNSAANEKRFQILKKSNKPSRAEIKNGPLDGNDVPGSLARFVLRGKHFFTTRMTGDDSESSRII